MSGPPGGAHEVLEDLRVAAEAARRRAYVPYTKFDAAARWPVDENSKEDRPCR